MTAPTLLLSGNKVTEDAPASVKKSIPRLLLLLGCLATFMLFFWQSEQISRLQKDVAGLTERIENLEKSELPSIKRSKRQAEVQHNLNEDGVPLRPGSYRDEEAGDTEGLRIYENWFQHKKSQHVPKSRMAVNINQVQEDDSSPIKPYHRTSASWVEKKSGADHDLNAHFDSKIFRNAYPSRGRSSQGSGNAIDLPQSNFYKITPTEVVNILELVSFHIR